MESGPSKVAETIAGYLLPPACREEILGDMRERYRSALGYFVDALQMIPCVIYSRICRTTDAVIALMEVASMYTAFVLAAKWFDSTLISANSGLARLAIPPVVVLVVICVADAYSTPQRRWPLKPLFAPILGFTVAYLEQSIHRQWTLPASVFALGSGTGLLFASTLRLAFPPITDRPHAAKVPAFWQKLELAPLSLSPKSALVPCGILLIVILCLLGIRGGFR
jgi:hypothetical protein